MTGEVKIVEENGVLTVFVQEAECAQIWPTLQPLLAGSTQACVLDFSTVSYLNSMSIASIISLRNKVATAGGTLALANLQENIKSVFRILKLEKLFDLDLDSAGAQAAVTAEKRL